MPTSTTPLIDRDDGEALLAPDELGAALYRDTADASSEFLAAAFGALEEEGLTLTERQKSIVMSEMVCSLSDLPAAFEQTITRALEVRADVRGATS